MHINKSNVHCYLHVAFPLVDKALFSGGTLLIDTSPHKGMHHILEHVYIDSHIVGTQKL
jgi:hypothetical protein